MHSIQHLEIHVAHACNLTCESCSHYSDQGHKGVVSLAEAAEWMQAWRHRLSPAMFSLVGGEPSLHPDLATFVEVARMNWPSARLRLVTNGFFLHRHPRLPEVLARDGNAALYLSVHHDMPEYVERLRPGRELVERWVRDYGIQYIIVRSFEWWTRRYRGQGSAMEPYEDGQPRASWEQCPARYCPQLFEEQLWKCPALAYLRMQNAKHRLSARWSPYLKYQPLAPDCTDGELVEFFAREDEPSCSMCPAAPEKFTMPVPLRLAGVRV